ncbi:unnamed protein product [Nippostrongylus brasiliensis]|uniref:DNA-directed RNA polymerase n=1 Tax=Nippostrongylus brasiliensis TaxID=27835 RepID=A0A0N4YCP5_NIPBR|nr:unnamed protein product [Nippostrongylus brasiliensis]
MCNALKWAGQYFKQIKGLAMRQRLAPALAVGREPEDVSLEELRAAMEKHYQPRSWYWPKELQQAANGCSFEKVKENRDAMVTMVFIGGPASVERGNDC